MQCAESLRVQAFFDGELDAPSAADMERHGGTCEECRALLHDLEHVRAALRQNLTYAGAPSALRGRIMRALDLEGAVKSPRLRPERLTSWRPPRPFGRAIDSLAVAQIFLIINARRWWSTNMVRTSSTYSVGRRSSAACRKTPPATDIT
jgi:anti-sigma factor RsiW